MAQFIPNLRRIRNMNKFKMNFWTIKEFYKLIEGTETTNQATDKPFQDGLTFEDINTQNKEYKRARLIDGTKGDTNQITG